MKEESQHQYLGPKSSLYFSIMPLCEMQQCLFISAISAQTLSDFKNYLFLISVNHWISSARTKVVSNYENDSLKVF